MASDSVPWLDSGPMNRLLLYHDFASPFSRLAVGVGAEAARRTGLELRPVPFELRPPPAPLHGPPVEDEEMEAAAAVAEEWGVQLGTLRRVIRTRKAHEAVAWGRERDSGTALLRGIYDALWLEGQDISRLDVLAEIGGAAGLDREALHVALGVDEFREEVVREQRAAASAGITGVPAMQVRDVVAVGLFPLDEVVEWIEANR